METVVEACIFHLQTIIAYLWINNHLTIKGGSSAGARFNSTAHLTATPGVKDYLSQAL